MESSEAMFWLSIVQQARRGNKEALETLRQENEVRVENNQPMVQEELYLLTMSEEDREIYKILQDGSKTIWRKPEK